MEEDEEEERDEELDLRVEPVEDEWQPKTLFPPMEKQQLPSRHSGKKDDVLHSIFADDPDVTTDIGKGALKIIGPSKQLKQFDKIRKLTKAIPDNQKYSTEYVKLKRALSIKIADFRARAISWIKTWQNQIFADTIEEPTFEDVQQDESASIVNEKLNLAEKILNSWGVKY